ncbi:putative Synergin gamma [Hypsibius exemplaris]|uniref:Synergin gamma n=1 Tax=Hypsibius exemplaris TaxID=2072580 RepID=A0A1W0XCK4_HYPEX|nr:putative Synergin gamma [Hypsibius exemplaris]
MRPAGSNNPNGFGMSSIMRGNAPGQGLQEHQPTVQFQGMGSSRPLQPNVFMGNPPAQPANFPSAYANSAQMEFGGFQGIPLPSYSAVPVQDPMTAYRPYQVAQVPGMPGLTMGSGNLARYPAPTSAQRMQTTDSPEERKRLAQQRQQAKMRQSFEASKNKSVNPNDLMGKIIADFGPSSAPGPVKPLINTLDHREVQSRPATPHDSPVMNLPRDRSGSLDISPQTSARLREPVSDSAVGVRGVMPVQSSQAQRNHDISDLMAKFSDLSSAGSPAKLNFAPLSAKNPQPPASTKPSAFFNASQSAVDWSSLSSDLTSAFTTPAPSGPDTAFPTVPLGQSDLPVWCSDINSLPPIYKGVMNHFKNQAFIGKAPILSVLSRSGLANRTLEHIWTTTCRSREDFLSRAELCAALGLVGLAQTSFDVQHLSIDVLRRIPTPPEPQFSIATPSPTVTLPPVIPPQQSWPAPQTHLGAAFHDIPLSYPVLQQQISASSHHTDDEDFAEFVSAPTHAQAATFVKQSQSDAILSSVKPERANIPPLPSAPGVIPMDEKKSDQSSASDQLGWGDRGLPDLPITVKAAESPETFKPSAPFVFRPEMIGRYSNPNAVSANIPTIHSFQQAPLAPAPVPSLQPILAERFITDPYAALRDLDQPETKTANVDRSIASKNLQTSELDMLSFDHRPAPPRKESIQTQFSGMVGVETPNSGAGASGDEVSVQSLEFGMASVDDFISLDATGPSLVLDNLNFGLNDAEVIEPDAAESGELSHVEVWTRTLAACSGLLEEACGVFNSVDDSSMLMKVIAKATEHIENLVEVYRVARRVYIGARSSGFIDDQTIVDAIKQTEEAWTDFTTFLSMAAIELQPGSMDFSKADLSAQNPPLSSVCGLCLLDVDAKSRSRRSSTDGCKLEHEGRFYHTACANFFVNCVDLKLPRLTYPN